MSDGAGGVRDDQAVAPSAKVRSRAGRRLSVVVPAHDEAPMLDLFFARIRPVLEGLGCDWEIVAVDDGSRDATVAGLMRHRARDPRVKLLVLSRNFGKELALTAGLDAATGDLVVPIDMDLQDPPELIASFLDRWEEGFDVAYGVRADRSTDTAFKRATARGFYRLFNRVSDVAMPADAGDFRLMDRRVVDALRAMPERNRFNKGLFAWVGFRQAAVPYAREARAAGTSSWRWWRLWNFALDGFVAFSSAPIRVWTYVGALFGVAAIALAGWIVLRTLVLGVTTPGYASLAVFVLFGSGVQMLAIGMLGEYVARIYHEVKRRPLYLVAAAEGVEPPARR